MYAIIPLTHPLTYQTTTTMKISLKNIVIGGIIASVLSIIVGIIFHVGSVSLSFGSLILLGFFLNVIEESEPY